jgi:hypothetical protein
VDTARKSLLVRADFVLGNRRGGARLACKRWRRVLADALPQLLGCADRRPDVRVRLHDGEGEARFSGWLRIPIERRPSRRRLRKMKAKLQARLEAGLLPIDGQVIKLGVRRVKHRPAPAAPFTLEAPPEAVVLPEVSAPRLFDGAEQPVEAGAVGGLAAGVGEHEAPVAREYEIAS